MSLRRARDEGGASLLLAMGVVTLLGVFATATLTFVQVGSRQGVVTEARTEQLYAADAGVEYGIRALAADPSVCNRGGATYEWPAMAYDGRTVTYRCEWVSGTGEDGDPRTARIVSTATGPGGIELTTAAAVVRPDGTPQVVRWELHGEWQSPGPSTTTTTVPPSTTTTAPPTTTTTAPPTTTTTAPPTTTTTVPPVAILAGPLHLRSAPGFWFGGPLPLSATAPTSSDIGNDDWWRDWPSGLLIERGTGRFEESNGSRMQEWTMAIDHPTRIDGTVRLDLWSKAESSRARGRVNVFLSDCDAFGRNCVTASASQQRNPWSGSSWTQVTFQFGEVDHLIAAGRTLRLKVVVDDWSGSDISFAYNSTAYPSQLRIE